MKTSFDRIRGVWKAVMTPEEIELAKEFAEQEQEQEEDPEYIPGDPVETQKFKGKCVLSIKFENEKEYEKWLKYNPGRKWDFLVNYPAVVRAEYEFKTSLDVDIMIKKIIQLLTIGFDVYSAAWKLEENEEESSCGKTEE